MRLGGDATEIATEDLRTAEENSKFGQLSTCRHLWACQPGTRTKT